MLNKGCKLIILILLINLLSGISIAEDKVSNDLIKETYNKETTEVLIILKDSNNLKDAREIGDLEEQKKEIKEIQNKVIENLNSTSIGIQEKKEVNINIKSQYKTINALSANITLDGLEKLAEDNNVKKIVAMPKFSVMLDASIPYINADDVWSMNVNGVNITGEGEVICVLDTGIDYNHSAFGGVSGFPNSKIIGGDDLYYFDGDPWDQDGHGTHVAATIASENSTYKGVAPDAKIIAVQVCNHNGSDCSALFDGIDWCVNNASLFNISSITLSIGTDTTYNANECELAMPYVDLGGMFVSAASGNGGNAHKISAPACDEEFSAVGSINDQTSAISSFTNRGSLLNLLAPGENIYSAMNNNGWGSMDGTSMATPHVAGAAALLRQYSLVKNGLALSRDEQNELLERTGTYIIDGNGYEYSIIDVQAAINSIPLINISENKISHNNGSIVYPNNISFDDINYCIEFGDNFVSVKSNDSKCSDFNVPAKVTLNNLNISFPAPYKNGIPCYSCSGFSYSGGNFSFNVTGFSNYTAGVNSQLSIYDDNDAEGGNQNKTNDMKIFFFANYTNITNNMSINNGWCNITISTIGNFSMAYNSTTGLYYYNKTFNNSGNYSWNVTCNATLFEAMTLSDNISIATNNYPIVSITSPLNQSVYANGSTITLTVNATDTEDGTLSGDNVVWYSNVDGNFANGTSVMYNVTNGTYVINVTATDRANYSASDSVTIYVKFAPVPNITSPSSGSSYRSGNTITFNGNATDIEDGVVNGTNLTWISSINGQIGTGNSLSTSSLSRGTHTITLRANDSDGLQGEDSITLTITSSSSGGSGGGGGGGGTSTTPNKGIYVIPSSGLTMKINTYDDLEIKVKNTAYPISVSGLNLGKATVDIGGIKKQLTQGNITSIDVDKDGTNDLNLKLILVQGTATTIEITKINEKPPKSKIKTSDVIPAKEITEEMDTAPKEEEEKAIDTNSLGQITGNSIIDSLSKNKKRNYFIASLTLLSITGGIAFFYNKKIKNVYQRR